MPRVLALLSEDLGVMLAPHLVPCVATGVVPEHRAGGKSRAPPSVAQKSKQKVMIQFLKGSCFRDETAFLFPCYMFAHNQSLREVH